jgi:DHA1 family tetracycline resistance protein-like MFS transporter
MEAAPTRKPAVSFIFVTLVIMMLGVGLIIPVLPELVKQFKGGDVAEGSGWYGILVAVWATMQFIASPILGALSDRFGRRRVILIALAGSCIDYLLMGLAPNIGWLFVARAVAGATAGAMAACNAYVADVTPPERRAQAYGMVGAAFGLGLVIGPVLGGLLGHFSLKLPFFAGAAFVAANWIYGYFVLPESLAPENRRPFSWKRANPVGALLALRRFRGVVDLAGMYFMLTLSVTMLQAVWVLYMGYRFGWGPTEQGLSLGFYGIMAALVQGLLVRRIIGFTGERRGLVLGLVLSSFAMVGYGTATHGWMIYAIILVGTLGGIAAPASQALITKHVPPTEQGALQGTLSSLGSLTYIFGPILAAWSFGFCIGPHAHWQVPGIAFYESAVILILALGLALRSFQLDDQAGAAAGATV